MSTWQDGGAAVATRTIKTGPGKLYTLLGRNTAVTSVYLFFYASVIKPGNGTITHLFAPLLLDPGAAFSLQLPRGRLFAQGLCWAASSTDATLTYASGATVIVSAEYD